MGGSYPVASARRFSTSVAGAFVKVCRRWGPPCIVHCDNGRDWLTTSPRLCHVCDYGEMELSGLDFMEADFYLPYAVGDPVTK